MHAMNPNLLCVLSFKWYAEANVFVDDHAEIFILFTKL